MSNALVGELYRVIIDKVVEDSRTAFEEHGVIPGTLEELQAGWQAKISAKRTADMPWDPKPIQQPPQPAAAPPSAVSNGLTPSSYAAYDTPPSNIPAAPRIKQESGTDNSYGGLPNGYAQQPQGGAARAAQLMQQQYGQAASASVNAMQRGGGLALPGGQQSKPQMHIPAQSPPLSQQQYAQQQAVRQQQQFQQQQQPQIKLESDSPHLPQQGFAQQTAQPNYNQTDGADDTEALDQWRTMLAQRRAMHAAHSQQADHLMRDTILQHSAELQSGLMMPLDDLPSNKRLKRNINTNISDRSQSPIPQMDGNLEDEDEDEKKVDVKDESDEDAINSDLDDDDDGDAALNDDDDETMDSILCTYDKVQRVKNKWKCTLKDGIMSANGKEWIFAKGMGEFEW